MKKEYTAVLVILAVILGCQAIGYYQACRFRQQAQRQYLELYQNDLQLMEYQNQMAQIFERHISIRDGY